MWAVLIGRCALAAAQEGLRREEERSRVHPPQFDATLATPLHKPDGFQTRRLNLYLTLTRAF